MPYRSGNTPRVSPIEMCPGPFPRICNIQKGVSLVHTPEKEADVRIGNIPSIYEMAAIRGQCHAVGPLLLTKPL